MPTSAEAIQVRVRDVSGAAPPARLRPAPAGALEGAGPVELALTGARLQARAHPGGLDRMLVWGSGGIGALRFEPPLPAAVEVRVTPNRIAYRAPGVRLQVAGLPDAPVVLLRGEGALPAVRVAAPRALPPGFGRRAALRRLADGWGVASDWAELVVRSPGGAAGARGARALGPGGLMVVAAGPARDEAERAAATALAAADPERELAAWCEELAAVLAIDADDELQGLFLHGLHAARASRRRLADGRFAGLAAGVGYAMPPRTYYRDGYWTAQALLPTWPELAREQLLLLAREVTPDGRAPSGVIVASPAGERVWRARRAAEPALAADHPRDGVWWADHTDAPSFFALLACEVAAWTADPDLFEEPVDGVTIGARVAAALEGLERRTDADGLPVKALHDRDWADNVFRGGHVTYDAALAYGALTRVAAAVERRDPGRAAAYRARARRLRAAARRRLWSEAAGHHLEFVLADGRAEGHLAIDTLTALRFGLAGEREAASVLAAVRARLETRHNREQPYGDWGVACVFPPYAPWVRRRGKSRFAYRYHDGADWPYWDGVYAEQRLLRGLAGWRYPLARWWQVGLAAGRATPVEYASPPFAPGSPSNGWSAMPAAAMLLGGFGLRPRGPTRTPPWGACTLRYRRPDGRRVVARVERDDAATREELDDG